MLRTALFSIMCLLSVICGAEAQNCSSYPYTLTNGQAADANQVMGNFNNILNCANNALAPLNNPHFAGNVGIGTTSPVANLDVRGPIAIINSSYDTQGWFFPVDGNTFALEARNNANTTKRNVVLNAWGGSVGVGTTSPMGTFHVHAGAGQNILLRGPVSSGFNGASIGSVNDANNAFVGFEIDGSPIMLMGGSVGIGMVNPGYSLQVNGLAAGTAAWIVTSDGRLKTNITPISNALNLVTQLRGVRFQWKPANQRPVGRDLDLPSEEPHIGFIAQEVQAVVPEAVVTPKSGGSDMYGLKEADLIPILVEAIKQQQGQITQLQSDLAALRAGK